MHMSFCLARARAVSTWENLNAGSLLTAADPLTPFKKSEIKLERYFRFNSFFSPRRALENPATSCCCSPARPPQFRCTSTSPFPRMSPAAAAAAAGAAPAAAAAPKKSECCCCCCCAGWEPRLCVFAAACCCCVCGLWGFFEPAFARFRVYVHRRTRNANAPHLRPPVCRKRLDGLVAFPGLLLAC